MPFITEELWQRLIHGAAANASQPKSVSLAPYPIASFPSDAKKVQTFELLQNVVTAARELRADNKLDTKAIIDATLYLHSGQFAESDLAAIGTLTKLKLTLQSGKLSEHKGLIRSTPDFDLQLHAAAPAASASTGDSKARIQKEIESLELLISKSKAQLSDETFLGKAPEKVVAGMRAKLADYEEQLAKNKKLLENLS